MTPTCMYKIDCGTFILKKRMVLVAGNHVTFFVVDNYKATASLKLKLLFVTMM